jgi:hypothetical protein
VPLPTEKTAHRFCQIKHASLRFNAVNDCLRPVFKAGRVRETIEIALVRIALNGAFNQFIHKCEIGKLRKEIREMSFS